MAPFSPLLHFLLFGGPEAQGEGGMNRNLTVVFSFFPFFFFFLARDDTIPLRTAGGMCFFFFSPRLALPPPS